MPTKVPRACMAPNCPEYTTGNSGYCINIASKQRHNATHVLRYARISGSMTRQRGGVRGRRYYVQSLGVGNVGVLGV